MPGRQVLRDFVAAMRSGNPRSLMLTVAVFMAAFSILSIREFSDADSRRNAAFHLGFAGMVLSGVTGWPRRRSVDEAPDQSIMLMPALAGIGGAWTGMAAILTVRYFDHHSIESVCTLCFTCAFVAVEIAQARRSARRLYQWGVQRVQLAAVTSAAADRATMAALQSQMSPHFLFNALNTVASLVATDPDRAQRTTGNLSAVLRQTLDRGSRPTASVADEVAFVGRYLEIERERFGSRLRVSIDIAPEAADLRLPTMSLQPLVENAIKYGVSDRIEGGMIRIVASRVDHRLEVTVTDDGPGFPGGWRDGGGLGNLRQRLQTLYGERGRLLIDPSAVGSRVTMWLPASEA